MRFLTGSKGLLITALLVAAAAAGCQPSENTNTTANANTSNSNATVNINSNSNANMTTSTIITNGGQDVGAKEPDNYSAAVTTGGATPGERRPAPQAYIRVGPTGPNRRYSVDTKLPTVGEI